MRKIPIILEQLHTADIQVKSSHPHNVHIASSPWACLKCLRTTCKCAFQFTQKLVTMLELLVRDGITGVVRVTGRSSGRVKHCAYILLHEILHQNSSIYFYS